MLEGEEAGGAEFVGGAGAAEGGAGFEGGLGEVGLAVGGEDELQLDEGAGEDAEEGLGGGPLVSGVLGGRQGFDAAELV